MGVHPMIEPDEGDETAFSFDGHVVVFHTRSRRSEPQADNHGKATPSGGKSKGRQRDAGTPQPPDPPRPKRREGDARDPVWDIRTPGVIVHDDEVDPVWGVHWPGISPTRVTMSRDFQSLEEVRQAIPQIVSQVRSHPGQPQVVLAAPHYGRLDPAAGLALVEELRRAGAEATIVVKHRARHGGGEHE